MTVQKIKKDYTWNTIGVFAQNAISPLLLIAITRINGIHDSGLFSFAFSLAIILWAFGMWGGRTYQVSDVEHEFSNQSYIAVRYLLGIIILLAALVFSLANGYDKEKIELILVLVLFKVAESIADAIYGVVQIHGRLYKTGRSLLCKAFLGFALFLIIDIFTKNILWASLGILLANLFVILFNDMRVAESFETVGIPLSKLGSYAREAIVIIRRCAPVAAVIFMTMFSLNIPRYYIDKFHPAQIGYFGIIAMPITLIGLVMTFALQPNVVALSRHFSNKNFTHFQEIIRNLVLITIALGLFILVATYFIGVPALSLVFGLSFATYKGSLLVLVLGGILGALTTILVNILIVVRRFKEQFYILLVTNILLVFVSIPVVKNHGLAGGAWLFTLVSLTQLVLLTFAYVTTIRRAKMQLVE